MSVLLIKKDPALLFPIAIAIEVLLMFGLGAHVAGKLSGLILFAIILGQILFLTAWGSLVIRFIKSRFFKAFWIPMIAALLIFNVFIALQLGPDFTISIDQFFDSESLISIARN